MNSNLPTTVTDLSKYAAEHFLQTAVFIDDKIYRRSNFSGGEPKSLVAPSRPRKQVSRSTGLKPDESKAAQNLSGAAETDNGSQFVPQDIVSSFAKKRIVCSLYEPNATSSLGVGSEAYDLCLSADIVIVDWDLHNDGGKKTLDLVATLLLQSHDDVPEQLRLILVYTQEPNLESINNEIFEELRERNPKFIDTKADTTFLHTRNTRVVVLGKPGHRPAQYQKSTVTESELAERAVIEFTQLASGLMQAAILLALAKIRSNSRRVLSKFDASLDPAFLTHRALSLPHEDALEHILPLLSDELRSIMEDCLPKPIITDQLLQNWCDEIWQPSNSTIQFLNDKENARAIGTSFCLTGEKIRKTFPKDVKIKELYSGPSNSLNPENAGFESLAELLHSERGTKSNHQFAILMSQRTKYDNAPYILQLGTVVKRKYGNEDEYLLCLQPLCDSVRRNINNSSFVFCKFKITKNGGKKNHTIRDGEEYVELQFSPKANNCVTESFSPDSKTHTVVARPKTTGGISTFTGTSGLLYEWKGQMKPDHAQRAVEQFASNLSRVGLTESEWLRLSAR
jgi:Response receiver domain